MKKILISVLVFSILTLSAFAKEEYSKEELNVKNFPGSYKLYGGIYQGVVLTTPMAKLTFTKNGTFKWTMEKIVFEGSYIFEIDNNNKGEYILKLDYIDGTKEVLNLKTINENFIPGLKNNDKKESYMTSKPIEDQEGRKIDFIFIK